MKKLILYDHLGNKTLELETFVEGQDFAWESPITKSYWLGKILLVDKEPEVEEEKTEPEPEPEHLETIPPELEEVEQGINQEGLTLRTLEVKREPMSEEVAAIKRRCSACDWTGTQRECQFGHNDFYCPNCGKEALKEVTDELETTGDKSSGKRRTGKTHIPKDSKKLHKKSARGQSYKTSS